MILKVGREVGGRGRNTPESPEERDQNGHTIPPTPTPTYPATRPVLTLEVRIYCWGEENKCAFFF